MYLESILGYLTWPALIIISYWAIRWALKRFERKYSEENE